MVVSKLMRGGVSVYLMGFARHTKYSPEGTTSSSVMVQAGIEVTQWFDHHSKEVFQIPCDSLLKYFSNHIDNLIFFTKEGQVEVGLFMLLQIQFNDSTLLDRFMIKFGCIKVVGLLNFEVHLYIIVKDI